MPNKLAEGGIVTEVCDVLAAIGDTGALFLDVRRQKAGDYTSLLVVLDEVSERIEVGDWLGWRSDPSCPCWTPADDLNWMTGAKSMGMKHGLQEGRDYNIALTAIGDTGVVHPAREGRGTFDGAHGRN